MTKGPFDQEWLSYANTAKAISDSTRSARVEEMHKKVIEARSMRAPSDTELDDELASTLARHILSQHIKRIELSRESELLLMRAILLNRNVRGTSTLRAALQDAQTVQEMIDTISLMKI